MNDKALLEETTFSFFIFFSLSLSLSLFLPVSDPFFVEPGHLIGCRLPLDPFRVLWNPHVAQPKGVRSSDDTDGSRRWGDGGLGGVGGFEIRIIS